ncbi:Uncharacterised protein [Mannheimia haemolytica]|uniref:Uncharacterized protein n=1 Tax=Mannheimia haemolytica TaxID=75985 RepID=A0A378MV92_MANHA|nr:Uncharacterised protein [Mannheimia haemolytica]
METVELLPKATELFSATLAPEPKAIAKPALALALSPIATVDWLEDTALTPKAVALTPETVAL